MSCVGCRYSIHVPSAPGPLPSRSSAPKLSRIKMNLPNVRWFRISQGAMQAKKTAEPRTTPARDRLPIFCRRYHTQIPHAGRNESREVLLNPAMPQSNPNSPQGRRPSRSSSVSACHTMSASNNADRLVSQTSRVHQNITLGRSAQAHADPTATFSEKTRRPMRKIGMHVSAEKPLFTVRRTNAESFEYIPKIENTAATTYG